MRRTIRILVPLVAALWAVGAWTHSGRTDKYGCHAGSKPRHCHGSSFNGVDAKAAGVVAAAALGVWLVYKIAKSAKRKRSRQIAATRANKPAMIERPAELALYDRNGNGKISCREMRKAGESTPVPSHHPAYPFMRDRDSDGWACDPWFRVAERPDHDPHGQISLR